MKPILSFAPRLTASHLVNLISPHLDHLLNVILSKKSLSKFFQCFFRHFDAFPMTHDRIYE